MRRDVLRNYNQKEQKDEQFDGNRRAQWCAMRETYVQHWTAIGR